MASEEDPLVRNDSQSLQQAGWKHSAKLLLGSLVLVAFGIFAGLFVSNRITASTKQPKSLEENVVTSTAKKKYTATQFISFTINTMGGLAAHGECKGRSVDPNGVCYLGNKQNITEDYYHRLDILREVLDKIQQDRFIESPDIDHSSKVLKIVMVPEFFLRGPFGAYSTVQILDDGVLMDVADEIRKIVRDDFFQHYLFVFGTVITARTLDHPDKPWFEQDLSSTDLGYLNFAPMLKGGSNHKHHYVITKQYISSADFLDRTLLPNPKRSKVHEYADISDSLHAVFDQRGTTVVDDNFVEIDGLRIGIEICLDHRLGVLWDKIQTNQVKGGLVDIQLIISAGMAIERGPNPVVPGGVVYLTDGEASSAACRRADQGPFDPDTVCRDDVAGLKHIPHGGAGYSDFIPITACMDFEKSSLLDGYYSLYQTQGCAYTLKLYGIDVMDEFKYYPPSIEIYPTVDLP